MPRITAEGAQRYVAELAAKAETAIAEIDSKLAGATSVKDQSELKRRVADVRAAPKHKQRQAECKRHRTSRSRAWREQS